MRSFTAFTFLTLVAGAFASSVARDITDDCELGAEICGLASIVVDVAVDVADITIDANVVVGRKLTNAERFSRGLSPAAPRRRHGTPTRRDPSAPSAVPTYTTRGYLQVNNIADPTAPTTLGYISKTTFSHAQYKYEADVANALIVDVSLPVGSQSGTWLDLVTENSDVPGFTNLGLVQGRDSTSSDIAAGSYNYGYIGSTGLTTPGSAPASVGNSYTAATKVDRTSESAIWSIDVTTGAVSLQWVNTDSTVPTIALFSQGTALYFGGDADAFHTRFPSPVTPISYTFVPIV